MSNIVSLGWIISDILIDKRKKKKKEGEKLGLDVDTLRRKPQGRSLLHIVEATIEKNQIVENAIK